MSVFQAVMPTGSYPSLMAGGVQCTQLYNNADLNDCVPENDKVFQAWVCTGHGISDTISNTPFANFGRTFYLTAVKTWYNVQDNSRFRVVQTLYSISAYGDRLIWTRAIDGAGTLGWSDWKEMVVANGSYPTLGAGYLAKQKIFQSPTKNGYLKIGTVPFASINTWQCYSAVVLINGIYRGSKSVTGTSMPSGIIEIETRKYEGEFSKQDTAIGLLCGDINTTDIFYVIENNQDMSVYFNITGNETATFSVEILSEHTGNKYNNPIFVFDAGTTTLDSAPANAVYAVVRNIASYAESIPAASQTVLGGAKMWVSNGKLYIKTT